ncbi:hypothetical protein [Fulvivirga lutimaris]|uniref:hypothetical protein n=1 Tax=Fulvivirga lutimaris TaxID=1819566 RepID=UPI0012BC5F03|nr:hypothetical protein [Fulvivirga lutimaris]MTI38314.1 hypothetical protein [Fulvivirga lutimaris]
MSSNTFNFNRFGMLFKQHFIHNNKLLMYSSVAYVGVIFILLTIVQMGQDRVPHDVEMFRGFLIGFVVVFGILYAGYSFPALRSKESTINYLMVPASVLEKFLFELVSRLGVTFILLPILFWITFHLQGYFFDLFTELSFRPIGFAEVVDFQVPDQIRDSAFWFVTLISSLIMLGFVLPFTGGAMFMKQPLVKTLFSVAIIVIFYAGCVYIALEPLGVAKYNPNDTMWLIPSNEKGAFRFFGSAVVLTNLVMLFVAFRKLKEREV